MPGSFLPIRPLTVPALRWRTPGKRAIAKDAPGKTG
jgi:hypothetical protein